MSSPRRLRSGAILGKDDPVDPKVMDMEKKTKAAGSSGQSGGVVEPATTTSASVKRKRTSKVADSDSKSDNNMDHDSKSKKMKTTQSEAGPSSTAKKQKRSTSISTIIHSDLDPKSKGGPLIGRIPRTPEMTAKAKEIAMQNDMILRAIAKKLPTCYLSSLRQTGTQWNRNPDPVKKSKAAGAAGSSGQSGFGAESSASTSASCTSAAPVPAKHKLGDSDSKADKNNQDRIEPKFKTQAKTKAKGIPAAGPPENVNANRVEQIAIAKTMQNELVLSTISKKLPTRNLLSLRPTCFSWNRNFLPQYAGQHNLIHLYPDSPNWKPTLPGWFISDYSTAMLPNATSATGIPVGGYNIHSIDLIGERDIKYFFEVFGKTITRLHLGAHELNYSMIQILRQVVFEWTPGLRELTISAFSLPLPPEDLKSSVSTMSAAQNQLKPVQKQIPKLRKLSLTKYDSTSGVYVHLLEDIFQNAGGLESLSLQDWSADILEIFCQTEERPAALFPALSRLKCLSFSCLYGLRARHLRFLIQLGSLGQKSLRLQELDITIMCGNIQDQGASDAEMINLIHQFLVTQSTSLRRLKIRIDGFRENVASGLNQSRYAARLPKMENLEFLLLQRDPIWRFTVQCDEGNFATNFPRLKQLEFKFDRDPSGFDNWNWHPPLAGFAQVSINHFAHEGVTSLHIDMEDHDVSPVNERVARRPRLSVLGQTWPSVTKLELQLSPKVLKLLSSFWTVWPGLVSLRIEVTWHLSYPRRGSEPESGDVELDKLLSGIPSTKFFALRRQLGSGLTMERLRTLQSKFKEKRGISDLQNLQEFVFIINEYPLNISDIGGYLGLAMMPSQAVQHVALIQRGKPRNELRSMRQGQGRQGYRISEECRTFMRSVFGPYTVIDL